MGHLTSPGGAKLERLRRRKPEVCGKLRLGFGAGPGSRLDWDNRWDLTVQARWNLTNLVTAQERKRQAHHKVQQAHLSYQYLQSRLALGVQEAHEESASTREQMELGKKQIDSAREAYKLSDYRLENQVPGSSTSCPAIVTNVPEGVASSRTKRTPSRTTNVA